METQEQINERGKWQYQDRNNNLDNLQTICANCHRLKTVMCGEHNGVKYIPENQVINS